MLNLKTREGRDLFDVLVYATIKDDSYSTMPTYVIGNAIRMQVHVRYRSSAILAACRRLERAGLVRNVGWRYGHVNNFQIVEGAS